MKKTYFKELGKRGAEKRWAGRTIVKYHLLKELSKYYGKDEQNRFLAWPSEYLNGLLDYVRKSKNK